MLGAAAEAIGNLVLAQHGGEALDVALVGGGEHDVRLGFHELAQLLGQRGDGAVEAQRGARVERDLAERGVLVEDVDGAELVEIEAEVRLEQALEDFGAEIDVFGPDEVADAGALVALLDLVPPAVDLVLHHGGLVDEEDRLGKQLEEMAFGAGDAGEELPAGEDGDSAGGRGLDGKFFGFGLVASPSMWMRSRLRRALTAASSCSVTGVSVSGSSQASSRPDWERCVSGSNWRMDSISSPKNSMRTGRSDSGE